MEKKASPKKAVGIHPANIKIGIAREDVEKMQNIPEMQGFLSFHDKLQRKMKARDMNRKMLDALKDSMGKIHKELDDLKKRQSEKPKTNKQGSKSVKNIQTLKK